MKKQYFTWEQVKAELDAEIAKGAVKQFQLTGKPAALYMQQEQPLCDGSTYAENGALIMGHWRDAVEYRCHRVLVDPTRPDGIQTIRTAR